MGSTHTARPHLRRGNVVVLTAGSMMVLLGFAALSIDIGNMYVVRAELQAAADSAALAAATEMTGNGKMEQADRARAMAEAYALKHLVTGGAPEINASSDVELGGAVYDFSTEKFTFSPGAAPFDSVRVTLRYKAPTYFAHVFGMSNRLIAAQAAAVVVPRDIAVVIDLSGSMKHDSYLRYYNKTQINARDMWCSLDGPPPSRPYIPGAEDETEYAGDTGPTIGVMSVWGDAITPSGYDPTTDPGLWYIPETAACTDAAVAASLTARGYSAVQVDSMMNPTGNWTNRAAAILGIAQWTPADASDTSIDSGELAWLPYPWYRKNWQWSDYISWTSGNGNKLIGTHPQFRYRFGLKTYVDWLLDAKDNFSQTDLTNAPEEPVTAVKDAVQFMVDTLGDVDHMALVTFGSDPVREIDLTPNRQEIADTLYARQANHFTNSTNMGGGLQLAVAELTSARARARARKVCVLMSDGANKSGPDPLAVAQQAADAGIVVYTVSVGYGADRSTMQAIAKTTGGMEFYAAGEPDEYTEQLESIFRSLGGKRPVLLIE